MQAEFKRFNDPAAAVRGDYGRCQHRYACGSGVQCDAWATGVVVGRLWTIRTCASHAPEHVARLSERAIEHVARG